MLGGVQIIVVAEKIEVPLSALHVVGDLVGNAQGLRGLELTSADLLVHAAAFGEHERLALAAQRWTRRWKSTATSIVGDMRRFAELMDHAEEAFRTSDGTGAGVLAEITKAVR